MSRHFHGIPEYRRMVGQYGTPLFELRERPVWEAYRALTRVMASTFGSGFAIAYAIKVNPTVALCRTLFTMGALAEVANWREVQLARSLGVLPSQIIWNGPCKPEPYMNQALQQGMAVHLESPEQVNRAIRLASPGAAVGLRIGRGLPHASSRFGLSADELSEAAHKLTDAGLRVSGLHVHFSSLAGETSAECWRARCRTLLQAAFSLNAQGIRFDYLDFGGSLKEPSHPFPVEKDFIDAAAPYVAMAAEVIEDFQRVAGYRPRVILEPGRFLVQHAGILLTRVVDVRPALTGVFAVLDAGVCSLPSLDSWFGDFSLVRSGAVAYPLGTVTLVGPSCMEEDRLLTRANSPIPKTNDLVLFDRVGAYHMPGGNGFAEDRPRVLWRPMAGSPLTIGPSENTLQPLIEKEG